MANRTYCLLVAPKDFLDSICSNDEITFREIVEKAVDREDSAADWLKWSTDPSPAERSSDTRAFFVTLNTHPVPAFESMSVVNPDVPFLALYAEEVFHYLGIYFHDPRDDAYQIGFLYVPEESDEVEEEDIVFKFDLSTEKGLIDTLNWFVSKAPGALPEWLGNRKVDVLLGSFEELIKSAEVGS